MNICNGISEISWAENQIYECETCGNHVCRRCALLNSRVCPNCYGSLFKLS